METVQEKLDLVEKTITQQEDLVKRLSTEINKGQQHIIFLQGQKQAFLQLLPEDKEETEPVQT